MRLFITLFIGFISLNALEKNDFAYERTLLTSAKTGIIKTELPKILYYHIHNQDLSDLAVFDADGKVMPHILKHLDTSEQHVQREEIPFAHVKTLREHKGEALDINYLDKKFTLIVNSKVSDEDYILDLSKMQRGVDYIQVASSDSDYILNTELACSDDLSHWRALSTSQVLANMTMQNSHIVKTRLNINSSSCSYLKIHTQKPLTITGVKAINTHTVLQPTAPKTVEFQLLNKAIEFEFPKHLKLQNLIFKLLDNEQLYKLDVFSKNSEDEEWHLLKHITVYTLKNGELTNLSTPLSSYASHYRIEAAEGSYLPERVELYVSYDPTYLYFLAQGTAPYTLSYGSLKRVDQNTALMKLFDIKSEISDAILDKETIVNIDANKAVVQRDNRAILVWLSLIVGVLLLGFMSYKLFTEYHTRS